MQVTTIIPGITSHQEDFEQWLTECTTPGLTHTKTLQVDCYWDYQIFCWQRNTQPMSPETFGNLLRDIFPAEKVRLKGGRRTYLYSGLHLKDAGDWQTPLRGYDQNYQRIA